MTHKIFKFIITKSYLDLTTLIILRDVSNFVFYSYEMFPLYHSALFGPIILHGVFFWGQKTKPPLPVTN